MSNLIETVGVEEIDPNPFRQLGTYPYVETKIAALQRSFKDVGMWEGVIVRPVGNRYEAAFGHHRIEAARRMGMDHIPVIVHEDLDDEQMLKMMGRENGEDYNADFNCMFETWEAATEWLLKKSAGARKITKAIEIAKFLGWVDDRGDANHTARACSAASTLLDADMVGRDDLKDMSVDVVERVVAPVAKQMKKIDQQAKVHKIPAAKVQKTKAALKKGLKKGVEGVKTGTMTTKEAASQPHAEMMADRNVQQEPAMFDIALQGVIKSVQKMLHSDEVSNKIRMTVDALKNPEITFSTSDRDTVDALRSSLSDLGKRAERRERELNVKPVTPLRPVGPKALPSA